MHNQYRFDRILGATICLVGALMASATAGASERRFTYTYESGVLAPGQLELEPWTTIRSGRDGYFVAFDERIEFEVGLIENLQTAFYLNARATTSGTDRVTTFEFKGVSTEWKYKLLDPVADPLGMALYAELTAQTQEIEAEFKIIVDRRFDDMLVAVNVVGELEWEFAGPGETEFGGALELDAGIAYLITQRFSAGLEIRSVNQFAGGEGFERSVLFLGPVLSFTDESFWVAFTALPQVVAFASGQSGRDLEHHEMVELRLLFGWHV